VRWQNRLVKRLFARAGFVFIRKKFNPGRYIRALFCPFLFGNFYAYPFDIKFSDQFENGLRERYSPFKSCVVQERTKRRTERRKDAGENLTAGPINGQKTHTNLEQQKGKWTRKNLSKLPLVGQPLYSNFPACFIQLIFGRWVLENND
jgi:hypothetical protein